MLNSWVLWKNTYLECTSRLLIVAPCADALLLRPPISPSDFNCFLVAPCADGIMLHDEHNQSGKWIFIFFKVMEFANRRANYMSML